jgi:hypothetical protein
MNSLISRSKKSSTDLTYKKLMTIILVVLVIAAILFLIFRADIISWVKSLPTYSTQNDTLVENIDSDANINLNSVLVGNFYTLPSLGSLHEKEAIRVFYSDNTEELTHFYWQASTPTQAKIYFSVPSFRSDVVVATYDSKNGGVKVDPQYLDLSSDFIKKYGNKEISPFSARALSRLDGSFFYTTSGKSLYKNKNLPDTPIKGDISQASIIQIKPVKTSDGKMLLLLSSYIKGNINVFYLKKGSLENTIQILADKNSFWNNIVGDPIIGQVFPDGRILLDKSKIKSLGLAISEEVTYSVDGATSLRVDYKTIYNNLK